MTGKPRVFIASSSEALEHAEAVFSCLERVTEPSVWTHDLFSPSSTIIESLERIMSSHDAGVVIFTPDDTRSMRGAKTAVPRDNAIFELGMLVGRLGRRNVFLVCPEGDEVSLPSDLAGIVKVTYKIRSDSNRVAAVSTACRKILQTLINTEPAPQQSVTLWNNVQERHRDGSDLRTQLHKTQHHVFVSGICLKYLVAFCAGQLNSALERHVAVEVLLPSLESADFSFYDLHKPYSSDEMRLSQTLWKEFDRKLPDSHRDRFSVTTTPLPLTHSIGIYDGPMYVNPFCIGLDSADLPGIQIEPYMPAYAAYVKDALEHVRRGDRLCGNGPSSFLAGIV